MRERFSGRWGLLLAAIGMAIGTGNIWRFPRVAAANGGGAFLVPWVIFLFVWSVPLLVAEFHLGRSTRRGPLGAVSRAAGARFGWMGAFVVLTSMFIFAYYSVVTGWCLTYVTSCLVDWTAMAADPVSWWSRVASAPLIAAAAQAAALLVAAQVIVHPVAHGLERVNRVVIPLLFVTLVGLGAHAVTLPGGGQGVHFLFVPDWALLAEPATWLEAASQSAWSTGAGWGLLLAYSAYAREDEDPVRSPVLAGAGNNLASILAALIILPTTFALLPRGEALEVLAAGNQGLTFMALPGLFASIPGGRIVGTFFFLALALAAFSSLLSMMELGVRTLGDAGVGRRTSTWITAAFGLVMGLPSALSMQVFDNQDWVWGVGLLVTGMLISLSVVLGGLRRFLSATAGTGARRLPVRLWLGVCLGGLIPLVFVALIAWWFTRAVTEYDPELWWHPFRVFSVGTCLAQWSLGLLAAVLAARALNRR